MSETRCTKCWGDTPEKQAAAVAFWMMPPTAKKEPKKFIKCSVAGHDIVTDDAFKATIPEESKQRMNLPCGCKNVDADEIKRRMKSAQPYFDNA